MPLERLTVTVPGELLQDIDRRERNRSKFVQEAIRHELQRRRNEDLRVSLENPHPETGELVEAGFDEWARALPEEDAEGLVDPEAGTSIRWISGQGWLEE